MEIILYLIVFFGTINLLRMTLLLLGSDFYTISFKRKFKNHVVRQYPTITVVIPAFNERRTIVRSIASVLKSHYPKDKLSVVVVDDGSYDDTVFRAEKYLRDHKIKNVRIITQNNLGKAAALNNGIKNYATGSLVMCLDSDSYIDHHAFQNAVKYFEAKDVIALSSNVKIHPSNGLLNLVQTFEYIICYQMKRAQTYYNIEYIIGGIGSMFRRSYLKKINFYDGNTVTEDIDITLKILQAGNKNVKVLYGSDVVSYTPSVMSVNDLIKQRYRWKWGRAQTFLKNKNMFFTTNNGFTKGLSWLYLPYALFSDFAFFLEPFFLLYIIINTIIFRDMFTFIAAFSLITFYNFMSILAEDTLSIKKKFKLLMITPAMYFLFYILSFVEYTALLKSLIKLPSLKKSLEQNSHTWYPVRRPDTAPDIALDIPIPHISFKNRR